METKICTKCKKELPTTNFYKSKLAKDGYSCYCKSCHKEVTKDHLKAWKEENPYLALINSRWSSLNQRSINGKYTTSPSAQKCPQLKSYRDKGITIDLTYDQFKAWMLANETLHNEIVARGDKSSIDRIDESLGYNLDNIQLIPLHQNIEKRVGKECKYTKEEEKEQKRIQNQRKYQGINTNEVKYNNLTFKSISKLSEYLQIPKSELMYKISTGKIIVETPNKENEYPKELIERKYVDKKIEYNGKFYKTQSELAKELNISNSKLSKMIKKNEIIISKQ